MSQTPAAVTAFEQARPRGWRRFFGRRTRYERSLADVDRRQELGRQLVTGLQVQGFLVVGDGPGVVAGLLRDVAEHAEREGVGVLGVAGFGQGLERVVDAV